MVYQLNLDQNKSLFSILENLSIQKDIPMRYMKWIISFQQIFMNSCTFFLSTVQISVNEIKVETSGEKQLLLKKILFDPGTLVFTLKTRVSLLPVSTAL